MPRTTIRTPFANSSRSAGYGVFAALGALALAACGSSEEPAAGGNDDAPSMSEMEDAVRSMEKPAPGQYRQTVEIVSMDAPGLPKEALAIMKKVQSEPQVSEMCLTQDDTEDGLKDMFDDVGEGKNCTYTRFDVSGGTLAAEMSCDTPGEGKAKITMDGTTRADGSDVTVAMDMTGGQAPMQDMKMTMHLVTQRIGDCPS